jgi:hypothetical protein
VHALERQHAREPLRSLEIRLVAEVLADRHRRAHVLVEIGAWANVDAHAG